MAIKRGVWLTLEPSEMPNWANHKSWARAWRTKDNPNDWIVMESATKASAVFYQQWEDNRIQFSFMSDGRYTVLEHGFNSIYLRYEGRVDDSKKSDDSFDPANEPDFNPASATAEQARQWLIWREYQLLRKGKVPQGWASVSDSFMKKIKEREQIRKDDEKVQRLTNGEVKPQPIKSERDTLQEIINSVNASARDKMAAQSRLSELDARDGAGASYNPQPVIKEID